MSRSSAKDVSRRLSIEIAIIGALYAIYTYVRNSTESSSSNAYKHAKEVIKIENFIGLNFEHSAHEFFLRHDWVIIAANYFYGSLHFVVTIFALFFVFAKDAKRYSRVRWTIIFSTLIALGGFVSYPLMPPRLLPHSYGFVDTLSKFPTFWSFNSKEFATISNQFAAMPSVHIIWSSWCVFALYPYIKKTWLKVVLCCYPAVTLFVIIITANHYILDAVGGWCVLGAGYAVSRIITSLTTRSAIDNTASLADTSASRL